MDLPGATTGAEEHLTFVEHLVSKYQFPGDKLSILDQEIADVRERCNDPNLYMVVIGEASSGKSTFINALIEAPLLKTDSIFETTAAATVLSYGETLRASIRLRSPVAQHHGKGAAPHLEFIAPDDAAEASQIYTFSKEDEPIHFGNGQNATPMSLEDLIRMVATEPALARQVISMHVNYPAHFLADNICIIDTPGLNAQIADLNPKQVTQQAVAHADGAIILTRANQALSHSLITLLHRDLALGEHIRRCAFLITKMDEIEDEHDHHRIMQRVHAVVRREFIPNGTLPPIFCGAPKLALDAAINGGPANPQIAHWQSQFATLKEHLVAYLQRQRATVIVEKTLRLLNDLFTTLDSYLEAEWHQFEADRTRLEAAIIPDLAQFTFQQKQQCSMLVEAAVINAAVQVQIAAGFYKEQLLSEVEQGIRTQTSLANLKRYVEQTLPNLPTQRMDNLTATLDVQSAEITQAANEANQRFEANFRAAYERLAGARSSLRVRAFCSDETVPNEAALKTFGDGAAFQGPKISTLMTGAVLGAMIGSMFPVIGTMFGAFIGLLASTFFGPSLNDRKQTLLNDLRPQLIEALDTVKARAEEGVISYGEATMQQLLGKIDAYAHNYQAAVQELRSSQAQEAAAMQAFQHGLEQDKLAVTRRRELVQAQLNRLSTITF